MPLGTKELFDTMLQAAAAEDLAGLESRKAEFLQDENNFTQCIDSNGDTLLHKSVHPNPQMVTFVLDNLNGKIDAKNALGKTALHEACKRNLTDCVNLLIERGADIMVTNEIGSTPFHTACACGSVDVMEILLKQEDVTPDLVDGSGCYPIHKCAYDGNERVIDVLLKHEASIDARDAQECTAVHIAVKMNRISFVQRLLAIGEKQGYDINGGDKTGNTLLHYAVARCLHDMVIELLERGADINKPNEDAYTPLHIAAQSFQPDSQEWEDLVLDLLRRGADPNATNELGGRARKRDAIKAQHREAEEKIRLAEEEEKKKFKEEVRRVHKERERVRREVMEQRKKEEEERQREEEARARKDDEERAKELEELEAKKKKGKGKKKDG